MKEKLQGYEFNSSVLEPERVPNLFLGEETCSNKIQQSTASLHNMILQLDMV